MTVTLISTPAAAAAKVKVSAGLEPAKQTRTISEYGSHLTWVQRLRDGSGARLSVVLDRSRGRTAVLPIRGRIIELDVGPGPDGKPLAVYVHCRPGCDDIWRYDYDRRRESRVRSVSSATAREGMPSVWGRHIAFVRGSQILLGDLQPGHRTKTLVRKLPDEAFDVELGESELAYVSWFLNGPGAEGDLELRLHPLTGGGSERIIDDEEIGDSSATGISALTFLGPQLIWQNRFRDSCRAAAATFTAYDVPSKSNAPLAAAQVPLGVSRAADVMPNPAQCGGND